MDTAKECSVCRELGSPQSTSNPVLSCAKCGVLVHQTCYRVADLENSDEWVCQKCGAGEANETHCIFCQSHDGAFQRTSDGRWAHVVCALSICEVYFSADEMLINVEDVKWDEQTTECSMCRKTSGVCVECPKDDCHQWFHATCAQEKQCYGYFNQECDNLFLCVRHTNEKKNKVEKQRHKRKRGRPRSRRYSDDIDLERQSKRAQFCQREQNGEKLSFREELEKLKLNLEQIQHGSKHSESSFFNASTRYRDAVADQLTALDLVLSTF